MRLPNGPLVRTRSTKPAREHGRHIFAYCNVSTNQVLYSLTQILQGNSALRQLPDAGANNNPPKLRKDMWRPLWSLTLPTGKNGFGQGLHAFKKLREYRKLHELSWEPPPELSRPTTQAEMDKIQERLDDRGGKKTETVYDIIKRRKKKMRQRMVMNQKANSIADLAAVLLEHDSISAQIAESKERLLRKEREKEVAEMLRLAQEARTGGLYKLDAELETLRQREMAKKQDTDSEQSMRSMTRAINALEKRRSRMAFATKAVAAAEHGTNYALEKTETAEAKNAVRQRIRKLKQQLQANREAESKANAEQSSLIEAVDNELLLATESQDRSRFKHKPRDLIMELEMIRRLHNRPESLEKAFQAYVPVERDIHDLRALAGHWKAMIHRVLTRYQADLARLKELQTKVDSGEAEFVEYARELPNVARFPDEERVAELPFRDAVSQSPERKMRIQKKEQDITFLVDVLEAMGDGDSIAVAETKVEALRSRYEGVSPEIIVKYFERGAKSQLKIMDGARMYATVLAKAKSEARASELAQQWGTGGMVETAAHEAPENDAEIAAIDEQEEEASGVTFKDVKHASKQIQQLSRRLRDVDNISVYEEAIAQLSRTGVLPQELRQEWRDMDGKEKLHNYQQHLLRLQQQVQPLKQARAMLRQSDGVDRLMRASEAARERAVAAESAADANTLLQQKYAAKLYETVASLTEHEDFLLGAPEALLEPQIEELPSVSQNESTPQGTEGTKGERTEPASEAEGQLITEAASESQPAAVDYYALLPSFPEKTTLPKRGPTRKRLLRLRSPVYSAAGVTVKWNNMLDAEFAETWPDDVVHEPMGLSRHTAPKAEDEAVLDVAEFKNREGHGYKGKKWAREVEKKEIREKVQGVTERILEAVRARGDGERKQRVAHRTAEPAREDRGSSSKSETAWEL